MRALRLRQCRRFETNTVCLLIPSSPGIPHDTGGRLDEVDTMKYATYIKKYGASIMALAMLSACAPSTVADATKEAESVTSGITSEPADASPDGEGSSDPPKILHLVSNVDGMLGKPGIASDTGYYDVSINADGSSNITYTDFETCNKIYLTSDLGAKQNTDADSSWVSGGGNRISILQSRSAVHRWATAVVWR